jgi:hypothetical protein
VQPEVAFRPRPPAPSVAGRWYLAILGLALAAMGTLFVWLMARSYLRARHILAWPEVQCTILSATVDERKHDDFSPTEYREQVAFGYQFQGQPYTSERLMLRASPWSSNRELIAQRTEEFPEGGTAICHVNPAEPSFAILKTDSLAPGYSIWFPALFVVGGLGITFRAALGKRAAS